jgi:hypothetical protein
MTSAILAKRAWNLTRPEIHYRHEAFSAGLRAAGYDVRPGPPEGAPGNALLIWNRYTTMHDLACRFEAAGGTVLVCENGYIGPGGVSPHHMTPRSVYALARGYHNDHGVVHRGTDDRWTPLGVTTQPWRASSASGHVLVCPNRPFGTPGRIMPHNWAQDVAARLRHFTSREIRVRPHPGNVAPQKKLADDLAGAHACVIWSSSAGVHALVSGIPVICEAPAWICKGATNVLSDNNLEWPFMPMRLPHMHRLAHAQFHIDEIASGEAFRRVLA